MITQSNGKFSGKEPRSAWDLGIDGRDIRRHVRRNGEGAFRVALQISSTIPTDEVVLHLASVLTYPDF